MQNPQIPVWSNDDDFFICKDFQSGKEITRIERLKDLEGKCIPVFKSFRAKLKREIKELTLVQDQTIECVLCSNAKIGVLEVKSQKVLTYISQEEIQIL